MSQNTSKFHEYLFDFLNILPSKFCPTSNIYLHANTKGIDTKFSRNLKKYFKKDILIIFTQNDCLLLAYSVANVWASH